MNIHEATQRIDASVMTVTLLKLSSHMTDYCLGRTFACLNIHVILSVEKVVLHDLIGDQ